MMQHERKAELEDFVSLKNGAASPAASSLAAEDGRRLVAILESVDSLAVLDHRIDSPTQPTLREALSTSTPLPLLRSFLANVTAALLRPPPPAPPLSTAERRRINEFDSLLNSLLDQLEQKYNPHSRRDDGQNPAKKAMLHRSIPSFDFFTTPGDLTPDQLRKLSQVADTDVISIMPPPIPLKTTPPVAPKLAEINSKPLPSLKHLLPLPDEPKKASSSTSAKMLYYGAFQSFGPKYDSTDATIGYTSSVSQYRSERRINQWETSVLSVEQNIPLRIGSKTFLLTAEESALLTALNLSPDLMVNQGIKGDANNLFVVEEELRRNEERLSVLMRGQWERLRTGKDVTVGAGVVENTTALQLIKSLSRLLAAVPPPADVDRATKRLPRTSTSATMSSLAREESFTGGLDGINLRAVKESAMLVAPTYIKGEEM